MRNLLVILFLLFASPSYATPPSRSFTYSTGTVISSSAVTSNEDSLFNYLQSGVDSFSDGTIVNADIHSSANIQSDKLNLTAIAQSVANSGSTTLTGTFAANGTTNSIGNGGSDVLTLNVPGGMTLSAATTWTLTGALTFSGTIADLGIVTTADINGGTMDGVQVGGTTATGELLVNDASDDADGLGSQGTSGQYLQSAGAGANPTFVTPLGVLLSTTSFTGLSSSGDITITSGKKYLIFIEINTVSTDLTVWFRFDDDATATRYAWVIDELLMNTSPTSTLSGDNSDAQISFGGVNGVQGMHCTLSFDTNDDVNLRMRVHGQCTANEPTGAADVTRTISGIYVDNVTGTSTFEVYASTGNFTGQITTYELN